MHANKVIEHSGVKFGTSGARGLVEQFTPDVCAAFTTSFVNVMSESFRFKRVSVAIDRRPSSPDMAAVCCSTIEKLGFEVDYFGVLPTPALAYQSMQANQPAIMITGSHIPFDRNGIKFYRPDGEITKADELSILENQSEVPDIEDVLLPPVSNEAEELYIQRYLKIVSPNCLEGRRIGIYQHSSAGRELYVNLFEKLGASVLVLGRSEDFVPIDTEAVSQEDIQQGKSWSEANKLDFLFSTDGDGDRPLIADETGKWLRGDIVGLLTAKYLGIEALTVPVSCNMAIEKSQLFKKVLRTKIGSPFVIEGMDELKTVSNSVAGFEANGGFLLASDITVNGQELSALPTRDAILTVIAVMALSIENSQPLSEICKDLPSRYTASNRLQNFATSKSQKLLADWSKNPQVGMAFLGLENKTLSEQNQTDGLRWTFKDHSIVHLRASGNAPELRCYVETDAEDSAEGLLNQCLKALQNI